MASKLLRRSGVAVGLISDLLHWRADTIYQVGIGMYHQEVDVLREEWPGVAIVGFEANPHIVKSVQKRYPGTIFPMAVVNKVGSIGLHSKKRHKDGSSIHKLNVEHDGDLNIDEVSASTLDAMFPDGPVGNRVLLWLDCEGSELSALKGAVHFVEKVEVINVEMTSNPQAELTWCKPVDVHTWLRKHGFWLQWTHSNRSSSGQYDAIYVREHLYDPRYCSCPYSQMEWSKCQRDKRDKSPT